MSDKNTASTDLARTLTKQLSRIERHRRRFMNDGLGDAGLSGLMYSFLLILSHNEGASQDMMSQLLEADKSVVARMSRSLEDMGCISRETQDDNRRRNSLMLTDKGRELLPVIRRLLAGWGELLMKGLSVSERETVISLLSRMTENLT